MPMMTTKAILSVPKIHSARLNYATRKSKSEPKPSVDHIVSNVSLGISFLQMWKQVQI